MPRHDLTVVYVPIDTLKPFAQNAQEHAPGQVAKIADSIRTYGFINPIRATPDGEIIAGHGRLLAARSESMDEVPVIYLDGLTDDQCRAIRLLDNQLTKMAAYDDEILKLELGALSDLGVDLEALGFSQPDLDALFDPSVPSDLSDIEAPPVPPEAPPALQDGEETFIRLKVPQDVKELFESTLAMAPGEEDWQKLEAVLMAFNPAKTIGKFRDVRLDG